MQDQLKDKNIIVTGANCGIGYEAALQFARMGKNNKKFQLIYKFYNLNIAFYMKRSESNTSM